MVTASPIGIISGYLFPALLLALAITVLGSNLLGDALRDVLDPRLRR